MSPSMFIIDESIWVILYDIRVTGYCFELFEFGVRYYLQEIREHLTSPTSISSVCLPLQASGLSSSSNFPHFLRLKYTRSSMSTPPTNSHSDGKPEQGKRQLVKKRSETDTEVRHSRCPALFYSVWFWHLWRCPRAWESRTRSPFVLESDRCPIRHARIFVAGSCPVQRAEGKEAGGKNPLRNRCSCFTEIPIARKKDITLKKRGKRSDLYRPHHRTIIPL